MIAATLKEQRKAKIRFFAVYIASVILIVVIVLSLWRNDSAAATFNDPQTVLPLGNEKLMQADAVLHARLDALDRGYSAMLSAGTTGIESTGKMQSVENAFTTTLDSLEKEAAVLNDAQQKEAFLSMVASFKKSAESTKSLIRSYTLLLNDTTRRITTVQNQPGTNDEDIQELKNILVEKEEKVAALEKQRMTDLAEKNKIISSLQNQLAQKSNGIVQPISTAGDSEWKQKYTKLKASHDNIAEQNNNLSRSYKTIVDDNRRLLSQLQATRKQ